MPFDYRIAQMVEQFLTGAEPSFSFTSDGEVLLSENLVAMFRKYDLDTSIRETSLIGDYSSTNIVWSQLNENEVVVHGAKMMKSWDSAMLGVSEFWFYRVEFYVHSNNCLIPPQNISLVISDWGPSDFQATLASLDKSNHPFSEAIVVNNEVMTFPKNPTSVSVSIQPRHGRRLSADLCTVNVQTPWFVMSNSLLELKEDIFSVPMSNVNGDKTLISYEDVDADSCLDDPLCLRDFELAQQILPGFSIVFDDYDFIFHTESKNEYCQFLYDTDNSSWYEYPSATSYVAYLKSAGILESLYDLSDRRLFGSNFLFTHRAETSNLLVESRHLKTSSSCILQKGVYKCPKKPKLKKKKKSKSKKRFLRIFET